MRIARLAAAFALVASLAAGSAFAGDDHGKPAKPGKEGGQGKGEAKDWTSHKGDIPFIIGREAGMKEAEFTGKPILFFYTATWWHFCSQLAGSAFKDAEVVKLAGKFVPILVDGDEDKEFGKEFGVSGFPNTVFADPRGKKIAAVVGAVPTAQMLDQFKGALKKIGPVNLKKAAKELDEAVEALAEARGKGDWRATLKHAAAIEKINHEGPGLQAAKEAKTAAIEEGAKRLAAARDLLKEGKNADARAAAAKVASDFGGTDPGNDAKALLKELDAADKAAKDAAGGEKK